MDNRKIIVSLYIAAGLVVWFLSHAAIQYFYISFYKVSRLPGITLGKEIVPALIGGLLFLILLKSTQVNVVMEESVSELKKVTWPGREDVVRSTYVVMVCIVIASFILAGFDLIWGKVIGFLLG